MKQQQQIPYEWLGNFVTQNADAVNNDPCGLLPSQLEAAYPEWDGDQWLRASMIYQAVEDWRSLWKRGRVDPDTMNEFSVEDAIALARFLFDDRYGVNDENFITLRQCCVATGIDLEDVRRVASAAHPYDYIGVTVLDLPRAALRRQREMNEELSKIIRAGERAEEKERAKERAMQAKVARIERDAIKAQKRAEREAEWERTRAQRISDRAARVRTSNRGRPSRNVTLSTSWLMERMNHETAN